MQPLIDTAARKQGSQNVLLVGGVHVRAFLRRRAGRFTTRSGQLGYTVHPFLD